MAYFTIYNGPMPTTASLAPVSTGTTILTMLQIKPKVSGAIVDWGISFAGAAVAAGIEVELLHTAAVFATVTASAEADCHKVDGGSTLAASYLTFATDGTGYTGSAEGTVAATTIFDAGLITPTNYYRREFTNRRPLMIAGNSYRIRVKAAAGVNAICYMTLEFQ
jgi:hypothetical protein